MADRDMLERLLRIAYASPVWPSPDRVFFGAATTTPLGTDDLPIAPTSRRLAGKGCAAGVALSLAARLF